ncbi:hypothetical protein RR42_m2583 [Cupriavidus basilensis]|uniref:Uncharacterized protein n=1 Tax=Cupriavidus basilensis TaxID=68895 RepID=A0A0C4YCV6_9BURK|nr:hypothetical protein RR42_m2583 [Cupriavidus basilensis]
MADSLIGFRPARCISSSNFVIQLRTENGKKILGETLRRVGAARL